MVGELVRFADNVYVRRLTIKDLKEVERISRGLYRGFDTFAPNFKDYAKNVDVHYVYGVFDHDTLVGFTCRTFFDPTGNSSWTEGLRVDETKRGKAYASILNKGTTFLFKKTERFQKIQKLRWMAALFYDVNRFIAMGYPNFVALWGSVVIPINDLEMVLKRLSSRPLGGDMLEQVDISRYLGVRKTINTKYREYICSNWRYYDAIPQCLDLLTNGKNFQEKCNLWTLQGSSCSLSSINNTESGLRYSVTIETSDLHVFIAHLLQHSAKAIESKHFVAIVIHGEYNLTKELEKHLWGTNGFFLTMVGYETTKHRMSGYERSKL